MSTVDPEEIARFSRIADSWWDPDGKFAPLHRLNPTRVEYIASRIERWRGAREHPPLSGLRLLDIGCGGGLVAEPMARLGADVTGVDASERNIQVASAHAVQEGLAIRYRAADAETLVEEGETFDVVLALEIIEHVANPDAFVAALSRLTKPGGLLILSTLNRTVKSYALAIVGAEYVLRWLPRGTHDWNKFLKPSETLPLIARHGFTRHDLSGMVYSPLTREWRLARDVSVNYLVAAVRED